VSQSMPPYVGGAGSKAGGGSGTAPSRRSISAVSITPPAASSAASARCLHYHHDHSVLHDSRRPSRAGVCGTWTCLGKPISARDCA
jgi:hypothetical protein